MNAWTFCFVVHLTSVGYALQVSYASALQLDKTEKKAFRHIVAKYRCCRNMKCDLSHGPLTLGGGTLRALKHERTTGQIKIYTKHWKVPSMTSDLLYTVVSWD
jgi:hypothetical protein